MPLTVVDYSFVTTIVVAEPAFATAHFLSESFLEIVLNSKSRTISWCYSASRELIG